jgi:putative tryptophan/tyrosine transport system substrate-binding protein
MRRREFIAGLGAAVAGTCVAVAQRRARLPVVGILWFNNTPFPIAAFRQGLADQGLVIGENVAIDFEFPLQFAQIPAHAAQLVERRVDVIFVSGSFAVVSTVKAATTTIPIVFYYGGDPVEDGIVASLGRPCGNVTGMTSLGGALEGKRLALLHELVPGATTIAFLTGSVPYVSRDRVREAAHSLGLNVLIFGVSNDLELERAFVEMAEHLAQALIVDAAPVVTNSIRTVITLAERHKIPAIYPFTLQARSGGLISYGTTANYRDLAAQYVAPIVKGAKPGDLPVQQPTKFSLVINMRTAESLGLTIPETLLVTADELIQ